MELDPNYEDYVLYVENLSIEYTIGGKRVYALSNVSFGVRENESVGIVGESGCGKSTLAMAICHILPQNSRVTSGRVIYKGQTIVDENRGASYSLRYNKKEKKIENELQVVRWKGISIVFQGALDSLNPLFTVGQQISDIFVYKEKNTIEEAKSKAFKLLSAVGLDKWVLDAFPHQLSGGMKQRVIIAMAIALRPSLVIADEPTTSLDVITQYRIIEELRRLKDDYNLSIISISHDVSMVSHLSDRLMVMYAGRIIEKIPGNSFEVSQHPYTYMLIESIPKISEDVSEVLPIRGAPPILTKQIEGCPFYDRCDYHADMCLDESSKELRNFSGTHQVACTILPFRAGKPSKLSQVETETEELKVVRAKPVIVTKDIVKIFQKKSGIRELSRKKPEFVTAVDKVSIIVNEGESVALVGETGSGKTTLSRMIGLLEQPTGGKLEIAGKEIRHANKKQIAQLRTVVQTIFQDPFQSINPRFSVRNILMEPLLVNRKILKVKESTEDILRKAMKEAELLPFEDYINKFPHQLSGGQRQRVSIARSLVLNPKILVADEPISMLDVSLRAGVLNLLRNLRNDYGVTLFYITHDIASAKYISDRIYVLYKGQIVESGTTEELIKYGAHPYTIALIISSIGIEGKISDTLGEKIFEQTEEVNLPNCKFAPRCPFAQDKCFAEAPPYVDVAIGHSVKCHFATQIYGQTKETGIQKSLNLSKLKSDISSKI